MAIARSLTRSRDAGPVSDRPPPAGFVARRARSDQRLVERLRRAGCVAAEEEASELEVSAGGDQVLLEHLVQRRVGGEPLAWVTGSILFAGHRILVRPGVYVPRAQSELLVTRALLKLPRDGCAVDLCTGSGAVAVALARARPLASVVGTELDPAACACARENGVTVYSGDLTEPLPAELVGRVDLVTAVAPYVPTAALGLLPRDSRDHEPLTALDGGPDGIGVLTRVIVQAAGLLRGGGWLLVELGGDEADRVAGLLHSQGYRHVQTSCDEDGDVRCLEAQLVARPSQRRRDS